MKKKIKSLGERDRANQYNDFVVPLTAEEKILETQQAHKNAQKDLNKAVKLIERAIIHYTEARFGTSKVIEILAKQKDILRDAQERIKKETYNALPYKELEQERISEKEFIDKKPGWSLKRKLIAAGIIFNAGLYGVGYLLNDTTLLGLGGLSSLLFGGALYFSWSSRQSKTIRSSSKSGPKFW